MAIRKLRKWVADVKTDSTHPPPGLFTQNATTIAKELASRKVSPKGPVSGLRMLTYFINRAGSGLSHERRPGLEKAKKLLSARVDRERKSMIRKLKSGEYRLYASKKDARTGRRRNLGTFKTRQAAEQHEREVQFFKRQG